MIRRSGIDTLDALGSWLAEPGARTSLLLAAMVLISALAAVDASHRSRALFGELERLRGERDALLEQRGRLLLERSTFSAYSRVETVASEQLEMRMPTPEDTELVAP